MKNLLIVIIVFCSQVALCQQTDKTSHKNERILEIDYDNGGGEPGGSITLNVRRDSTFYFSNVQQGRRIKKLNTKTTVANWNKLITQLDLAEFDKTPNGQRQREVDGIDTRIYIKTTLKTHALIIDTRTIKNYSSANNLLAELVYQVSRMDKNATVLKN